jgi:tripartite-type tricarboxylate transporter receptor subunit TctC
MRFPAAILLSLAALVLTAGTGAAAGYPDRPIRIVVPFEAGGGGDIIVRLVGHELSQRLGQPVVVENRAGASAANPKFAQHCCRVRCELRVQSGTRIIDLLVSFDSEVRVGACCKVMANFGIGTLAGNIGSELVARASPDGYTLLMSNVAPMAINKSLFKRLPYDPVKDFTAIAPLAVFANVLVVPPSLGVHSVSELVALSKRRPEGLNYASAGAGSITNLAATMFRTATGANMTQVPYRGGGPAIVAVVGAQVDLYFSSLPAALPFVKDGKLIAPGVSSANRSDPALEIPTLAESGRPGLLGFEAVTWIGLVGPAGLADDIVAQLNAAVTDILRSPAIAEKMRAIGAEPSFGSAAQYAAYIRRENARWAAVVRAANIPAQ